MAQANDGSFKLEDTAASRYVDELTTEMPEALIHRRALRQLKSDFSYARRNADGWTTLVHFSAGIAGTFGFTRDVCLVYSRHNDLQPRTFKGLIDVPKSLPVDRSCEDHVYLVHSPDIGAPKKLDHWSSEASYLAMAVPRAPDEKQVAGLLIEALTSRLATRNLYDETLPVTGRDFFGRRRLLQQLTEEIRLGHVCGVFGLRKTGKTSLIKELGQRFQLQAPERRIFLLRDLETLPNNTLTLTRNVLEDIRSALLTEFRQRGIRTLEITALSSEATTGEFRRAMRVSLLECEKRGIQVLVALDEIESLLGDADEIGRGDRGQIPELLGMFRSLVQEHQNFNVLIAGITSAATERGELYGRENPLFAWAKSFYIPPMSKDEIDLLTREVGSRMALTWRDDALDLLFEQSGGHIFMHRTLASEAIGELGTDDASRVVTRELVTNVIRPWRRATAQRLAEMLVSTRRHYPVECDLLDIAVADPATLTELESLYPAESQRLIDLGLLEEKEEVVVLGPLARQLVRLGVL